MRVLVYIEEREGSLVPGSLGLLAKVRALNGEPVALLCGSGVRGLAAEAVAHGAARVLVADDEALAGPLAQPRVDVVADVAQREAVDAIVFENSALTADVAGAVAARVEAGVNWDLVDLHVADGELVGDRLALGDSALVRVGWSEGVRIAVLRRGSVEPVRSENGRGAPIEDVSVAISPESARVRIVERSEATAEQGSIETADIIVAGGRGMQKKENLGLLEDLAGVLGAAVAVTMPLVDRGWYPYAHQVGQTGRTVRPDLYLACGISGAVQHRVGMEKSGTIVAINTDRTAPIFGVCDVGVVGDALEIVPKLADLVRTRG